MSTTVLEPVKTASIPPSIASNSDGRAGDIELMSIQSVRSREAGERDPLLLRSKIKTDDEIQGLRSRGSKGNGRQLAQFYSGQNEHIDNLLKPLAVHTAEANQKADDMALKVKIAVNVSFAANIILAGVQLYAAISSMSLALFASCIDAGEWTVVWTVVAKARGHRVTGALLFSKPS